jgi:hypothetical protein
MRVSDRADYPTWKMGAIDVSQEETLKLPALRRSHSIEFVAVALVALAILCGPLLSILLMGAWTEPLLALELFGYPVVALIPYLMFETVVREERRS